MYTVWECQSGGSNNNGAGFRAGLHSSAIDYSRSPTAHYTNSDLVIGGSGDWVSSAGYGAFTNVDLGNIIKITAGTGFTPGRYKIIAVSAGSAQLHSSCGTPASTGGTFFLGGAGKDIGDFAAELASYDTVYVKDGTFNITTATPNTAGGPVSLGVGQDNIHILGYYSSRDDCASGGRPKFAFAGSLSASSMFTFMEPGCLVGHIEVDGLDPADGHTLCNFANVGVAINCKAVNCDNGLMSTSPGVTFEECRAETCAVGLYLHAYNVADCCYATGCDDGFSADEAGCFLKNCGAQSCDRDFVCRTTITGPRSIVMVNCTGRLATTAGYSHGAHDGLQVFVRCIMHDNAQGWTFGTTNRNEYLYQCGSYNNAGGDFDSAPRQNRLFEAALYDPYEGSDWTLNAVVGGGADLRNRGISIGVTSFHDTGSHMRMIAPLIVED